MLTGTFGKPFAVDFEDDKRGNPSGNSKFMWWGEKATLVWNSVIQPTYEEGWEHNIDIILSSTLDKQNDW